jgi:Flp pilus assembly protein TadG
MKRLLGMKARGVRDRRGAVAVEFALIMPVFLMVVLFMLDIGIVLATQVTMDSAAQAAARQIKIGTMRTTGSAAAVRSLICAKMGVLVTNCANIQVYATSGTAFGLMTRTTVIANTFVPSGFNPGTSQNYVLLQIGYYDPLAAPVTGISNPFLVSTVAFENEE